MKTIEKKAFFFDFDGTIWFGRFGEKTLKALKDLENLPEHIQKTAKKPLGPLNKAQLAGYLFSGLVLGLGIPNLNIYITNKLDQKRKAQQAEVAKA